MQTAVDIYRYMQLHSAELRCNVVLFGLSECRVRGIRDRAYLKKAGRSSKKHSPLDSTSKLVAWVDGANEFAVSARARRRELFLAGHRRTAPG
jgi:hypothetical protein